MVCTGRQSPRLSHCAAVGLSLTGLLLGIGIQSAQAQVPGIVEEAPPKVVELLKAPLDAPEVTARTPSKDRFTLPSLWWTNQLSGDKMVLNWLTYPQGQASTSQVRLIVRPDLWSRYTYLERYAFLQRFGGSTSAAGYNLLVLDRLDYPLASYTCAFPEPVKPAPLFPWQQSRKPAVPVSPQVRCSAWISPVYASQIL